MSPDDAGEGAGETKVCLGVIASPHGVHGRMRIKTFTAEPEAIGDYGPVETAKGSFALKVTGTGKGEGVVVAELEGITRREQAEALRGLELYVPREKLGAPEAGEGEEEAFFHADLVGLEVAALDGKLLGRVIAVHDFGAGDLLEIEQPNGKAELLPFTKDNVPEVKLAEGRLIADPPEGLFEPDKPRAKKRRRSPRAKAKAEAQRAEAGAEAGKALGDD